MPRILALDIGEKTIGVAVSDEPQERAFPVLTIARGEGYRRDAAELRRLTAEHAACEIVVGLPLNMDGSEGPQAGAVREFVAGLRGYVRVPIRFEDERLTTWEAEQALLRSGTPRSKIKQTVDANAAALILEAYLARRKAAHDAPEHPSGLLY